MYENAVRHWDSILELNILLTVILCANTDKLFILNHVQGNQTFLTVFDLHHTFNGIIQHISEKSTDIHILHKIVEKYGGSVMAGKANNWFELKILIPMKH